MQEALKRYHVLNKIIEIIGDYYHNFQMRTVTGNTTSAWHYLERMNMLKKGKLIEERFKLSGEFIPSIKQNPVKSLGKRFDDSLKDTVAIQETKENLERRLNKIERSGLPDQFKA